MSKPRRASPSMGDEVHMRLYDMSHGMAKNMSMPLLGRQVRSYLTCQVCGPTGKPKHPQDE